MHAVIVALLTSMSGHGEGVCRLRKNIDTCRSDKGCHMGAFTFEGLVFGWEILQFLMHRDRGWQVSNGRQNQKCISSLAKGEWTR